MIEATCSACGTLNRVSEASVPGNAKFVACAECKARIALPAAPLPKLPPAIPKVPPPGPAAKPDDVIDLADLPAPKRLSALGPPPKPAAKPTVPAVPPVRSGLAAALDPELPAPKAMRSAPTLDLDDLLAPEPALDDGADLPAPKKAAPVARPAAIARPEPALDLADLPAPRKAAVTDLPAPKPAAKPAPPPGPAIADLPAPREPKRGPLIADLPAPRAQELAPRPSPADLPAPKGFFDDLPAPSVDRASLAQRFEADPLELGDELPAPKGFFDDLPQPALHREASELPAPKGFFDDLPQVKANPSGGTDVLAPKGFFDDLPGLPHAGQPEVPAPKGYFENLPDLPHGPPQAEVAPKGYFDNVPGLPLTQKPEVPAPKGFFDDIPGLPHTQKPEVPAPKGFFDNVPGRPTRKPDQGFFDDLPRPAAGDVDLPPPEEEIHLEAGAPELDAGPEPDAGPELDLLPPASAPEGSFDDLDLSSPSAPPKPTSPVRFDPPRPVAPAAPARADDGLALELEAGPEARQAPKLAPRRPAKPVAEHDPAALARKARQKKLALAGVLAVAVLGAGGFVLYQRHVAAQAREAEIASQLAIARSAYAAADAKHWQRAGAAARQVVELDGKNAEALGIGAEALLASALADGVAAPTKIGQARRMLDTANSNGISSPMLARARALAALAAHQPDSAIKTLVPLATAQPKDATLALYQGWALDAGGDPTGAVAAFDRAIAGPPVKLPALYGRGLAKLELLDVEGARADLAAVLELDKDHIGAQVGLAAAQPDAQQQEADLVAILARKDIAAGDPRAVARAWTLAADAAARSGRVDVARERYHKALAVLPGDLTATVGLARTELGDGKVGAAADLIATALQAAKDDVAAQLVQSEIELRQNKLPLAAQRLAALANHATPLTPLEQAQLNLVTGRLLEAQGKDDAAVDAYVAGARVAKGKDLAPLMAAVGKLSALTAAAIAAKDTGRAGELRARSEQILGELAGEAERDPRVALALGVAYVQEGNAEKAEPWLRRVVEARPNDAEARFQLGRALLKSGQHAAALEALNAAVGLDPARSDIAVELARAYEALGQDGDAAALYAKLLAGKDPTLELRARAGRFYARTGALDKAGEQGARIAEADPQNPAGFYLKGEALLAAGKAVDARQAFLRASDLDRDPQYLDALGRAAEALGRAGDREQQELALRSYVAATESPGAPINAYVGQGRLYAARHEAAKAVPALIAASRQDPKNAEVMFLMGLSYQELQQPAVALQWFEASTKLSPNAEAFWQLGQLYRDTNQGAPAAAALTSATRLAAEAEKKTGRPIAWLTDALYLLGRVQLDLHNEAAARDAWQLYVGRSPQPSAQLTEVKQMLATSLRR
jgi:tetratricopeptide (TPR) repeat protein